VTVAVADAGPEPAAPSRSAALSPDQESPAAGDPKEKVEPVREQVAAGGDGG